MDNARKKYVIIKRLSSGDVFALLDSMESDAEGDLENIMNDSDTEFVAEDESVISTNIFRKEEISDQSSSVSVPEASIHILPTQNEDETVNLGQDEPNSDTKHTSNQYILKPLNILPTSHLLPPINVLPISHLLLLLNVLPIGHLMLQLNVQPISHLLLLLLDVLPIIHPNLLLLLQLYPKHEETEAKLEDQSQNEKE